MIKADVIFDSRDVFFKDPQGAVTADTDITFRILVSSELSPRSVRLVMLYDRHDSPAVYELRSEPANATADAAHIDYDGYSLSINIHDTGLYWYHFDIETDEGVIRAGKADDSSRAIADDWSGAWQQTVYRRQYDAPEWIYGGVFYHVFVDRFHRSDKAVPLRGDGHSGKDGKIIHSNWGEMPVWKPNEAGRILNNDFFGGDIEGIRQKLPYLAELNVSCLYLSPIFEAYSNHKYDTGDYESIDPMFGDEEDLKALCRDAEKLGMRVILDGVLAHSGSDSRYFDRYGHYADRGFGVPGAWGNLSSPYRSWYYFHEDGSYDCWWDFDTLPKINKSEASYIDYINGENGIVRRWLRAGVSGWRLDVADELPGAFLDKLVEAAKTEKRDSIIIGEVWEDASNKIAYDERKNYFEGGRLDSVMNYPFRTAIIDFIRNGDAASMAETVGSIVEHYPADVLNSLMNVLSTHDSYRIITALAGKDIGPDPSRELQASTRLSEEEWSKGIEMLKAASLLQMTLPGVPCIYYGDEAGTEGYKDPFNRTCFPWGNENRELLDWYKKITALRVSLPVLKEGGYKTLSASKGFFAFERTGDAPIITAVNRGNEAQHLELDGSWQDLLSGRSKDGSLLIGSGGMFLLTYSDQ